LHPPGKKAAKLILTGSLVVPRRSVTALLALAPCCNPTHPLNPAFRAPIDRAEGWKTPGLRPNRGLLFNNWLVCGLSLRPA